MTATDGPQDVASDLASDLDQGRTKKAISNLRKTTTSETQDQLAANAHLSSTPGATGVADELDDDLLDAAQTDEEPDNIELLDAEGGGDHDDAGAHHFADEADPDVAAVDKVLSASRKEQAAQRNSSIRRMLEERSEARQLRDDLDYLDFDD